MEHECAFEYAYTITERLRTNLEQVIFGKRTTIDHLLIALLAGGHVLLEDVPGVGKTTLAKALAKSISAEFRRVQFTPDLLPADITGGMVYNPSDGSFRFNKGPVFTNILLADEINRASPRTQSSLLEAMAERQVSIDGTARELTNPFFVIATQNPVAYHGTYPLPEGQLDRFLVLVQLGYPDRDMEMAMLFHQKTHHPLEDIAQVATCSDICAAQETVRHIELHEELGWYITDIVRATRNKEGVRLGAGPRASLALFRASQAAALLAQRTYVIPDDVRAVAAPVLRHRLVLDARSTYEGVNTTTLVSEALNSVHVIL